MIGYLDMLDHEKNDSTTWQKTLGFICKQKGNFILHFIHTILHFKESCNLISVEQWPQGTVKESCNLICLEN